MYLSAHFIFRLVLATIKSPTRIFPWLRCLTWSTACASLCSSGPGPSWDACSYETCSHRSAAGQPNVAAGRTVGWATVVATYSEERNVGTRELRAPSCGRAACALGCQCTLFLNTLLCWPGETSKFLLEWRDLPIWKMFSNCWNPAAWGCVVPYGCLKTGHFLSCGNRGATGVRLLTRSY